MALVVSGVTRFSVIGDNNNQRPSTVVLDFQIDTTGTGLTRQEANHACAGNIINSWVEHCLPQQHINYSLNEVRWVDLDSAEGDTGSRTSTSLHTLPSSGSIGGEPATPSVSVLFKKNVPSARGQRNGRMYFPGLGESQILGYNLVATSLANMEIVGSGFLAEVNDEPLTPTNFDRSMVVVHTTGDNPQTGTFSRVDTLIPDAMLATQRRRLRK